MNPSRSQDVEVLFEKIISKADTTEPDPDPMETMDENVMLAYLLKTNTSFPGYDNQRKGAMGKEQLSCHGSPFQSSVGDYNSAVAVPLERSRGDNLFGHHRLYPLKVSVTKQVSTHSRWTEIPNANLCSPKPSTLNETGTGNGSATLRYQKRTQKPGPSKPVATAEVRARIERNQGIRILEQPIRCLRRCSKDTIPEPVVKRFMPIPEIPVYAQPPNRSRGQDLSSPHKHAQQYQIPLQVQPRLTVSTATQTDFVEENVQLKAVNDVINNEHRKDVTLFKIIIENLQRRIGELTQEKSCLELFVERNICWNCGGGNGNAFTELCSEITKSIEDKDNSSTTSELQFNLTSL